MSEVPLYRPLDPTRMPAALPPALNAGCCSLLQWHFAHKEQPPSRTLPQPHAYETYGDRGVGVSCERGTPVPPVLNVGRCSLLTSNPLKSGRLTNYAPYALRAALSAHWIQPEHQWLRCPCPELFSQNVVIKLFQKANPPTRSSTSCLPSLMKKKLMILWVT